MPWIPLVLAAIFLSACVTVTERDEMSPYFTIPAGSRLILNRDLEIPAHRTTLFVQYGQVLPYAQVN